MKPMTLFQPMHRLREWCALDPHAATYGIAQVQADALHVLNRHDLLHRIGEEREKHIWYQQGTEGNGNVDISWQERAEDMERKLEAAKVMIALTQWYYHDHLWGIPAGQPYRDAMEILES